MRERVTITACSIMYDLMNNASKATKEKKILYVKTHFYTCGIALELYVIRQVGVVGVEDFTLSRI